MGVENLAGAYLGIKLVNGKIKPKYGIGAMIGITIMIIALIGFIIGIINGIMSSNLELIIVFAIGIIAIGYLLLISPYTQNSNNYYIQFQHENSLENFKLKYKNKEITIKYKIGKDGKISFANNNSKLDCISYSDGSNMSNFTKYRIINYFSKWLNSNNLLSSDVTVTFKNL